MCNVLRDVRLKIHLDDLRGSHEEYTDSCQSARGCGLFWLGVPPDWEGSDQYCKTPGLDFTRLILYGIKKKKIGKYPVLSKF